MANQGNRHRGCAPTGLSNEKELRGNSDVLEVRRVEITSKIAEGFISALNAELDSIYPEEGANHFRLDEEETLPGRGAFLVAFFREDPVGCGAIRRVDADTVELKRMYVNPAARGLGVGRTLLNALEQEARNLDARRIVLEAGDRQTQAMALYERCGYRRIAAFGEYVDSPLSVCMEKRL